MAFDLLSFLLGKSTGSGGGGGSAALGPKTIRKNGVYRAASDNLDGFNTVTVEVPNTYAAADEGKVVSNGALTAQTSRTVTENGTYDTTLNDEVVVNVSGGEGGNEETGSFIAGSSQSNVTIAVTALHSHVLLWDSVVKSDDDISSAPYGTKKTLLMFADNNTGFIIYGGLNSNGNGFASQLSGIGRWGSNTQWNDRAEFTSSTIKIINPRILGTIYPWIDGHTINWRAW